MFFKFPPAIAPFAISQVWKAARPAFERMALGHDWRRKLNLLAHGIDVVDIADITRLLIPPMAEELSTIFTTGELSYCGESNLKIERLAGRLAIKEAVLKALGTGFGEDIGFVDVEVVTLTSGQPTVKLHDKAALVAKTLGITSWIVSSTHTAQYAFASVIGLA